MNNTSTQSPFNRFSFLVAAFLGLFLMVGLAGCGGGGGGSSSDDVVIDDDDVVVIVTPDQEASGLYKDGIADLDGSALMLNDLRGFVHEGRVIIFSATSNLLFDGTVTAITGDEYTATVDVYENGIKTQTAVAVTGMVTSQSQISGTISGTGNASGTFTLTFDLAYDRGATADRIDTEITSAPWGGPVKMSIVGVDTDNFDTFSNATGYDFRSGKGDPLTTCIHVGSISITNPAVNIFSMQESITDKFECVSLVSASYSGFAAVVDGTGTDDMLLYAVIDGTHSVFAVLTR